MTGEEWSVTKVPHDLRSAYTYTGTLLSRDEGALALRCPWTAVKPFAVGSFMLEAGDVFVEWFWPGRWFNVFAVYDAEGGLKGWYCNITYPVEIDGAEVRWRDLALDLLLLPDGSEVLLDEDEFEALRPTEEERRRAAEALATLRAWRLERRGPFGGSAATPSLSLPTL